jgi:hypothetical protein
MNRLSSPQRFLAEAGFASFRANALYLIWCGFSTACATNLRFLSSSAASVSGSRSSVGSDPFGKLNLLLIKATPIELAYRRHGFRFPVKGGKPMKTLLVTAVAALSGTVAAFGMPAQAAKLFFEGDMVRGSLYDVSTGPTCVLASQYKRQEQVVWRVRVRNAAGETVDRDGLRRLIVQLPDGQSFNMYYGTHPRGRATERFWTAYWAIPADYPTGTIGYKVVAIDLEGMIHEWEPFIVEGSKLTIIPGEVRFIREP